MIFVDWTFSSGLDTRPLVEHRLRKRRSIKREETGNGTDTGGTILLETLGETKGKGFNRGVWESLSVKKSSGSDIVKSCTDRIRAACVD